MRRLICVALLLTACGASNDQLAWCGENLDAVHAAFVEDLYGPGTLTVPAAETEVGRRIASYFPSAIPPAGMNENERQLVDRACATAYGDR